MVSLRSGLNTSLPFRKYQLATRDDNKIKSINLKKYSKKRTRTPPVSNCDDMKSANEHASKDTLQADSTILFLLNNIEYFTDSTIENILSSASLF